MPYSKTTWTEGSTTLGPTNLNKLEDGVFSAYTTFNVKDSAYGAKGNGVADDGPAILAAAQASLNVVQGSCVYIPAGTYKITTPIDLSTLTLSTDVNGWGFICDPAAIFQDGGAGGATGAILNLTPPGSHQVNFCRIQIGRIIGLGATTSRDGIRISGINDSIIEIGDIYNVGGDGLHVLSPTTVGTFNNDIRVGRISTCQVNGFVVDGNATVWGFQANRVWIGQCTSNANGIIIDASGNNLNSAWNHFDLGVVESNTGVGILDNNGANWWDVANTNSNAVGFDLSSGAANTPTLRGFFTDGLALNGKLADAINFTRAIGDAGGATPAVPSSTTDQANPFERPVMVHVSGGTVSAIAIGGVSTGLTSGSFRLVPGQKIKLTYSVAPTWKWMLTN